MQGDGDLLKKKNSLSQSDTTGPIRLWVPDFVRRVESESLVTQMSPLGDMDQNLTRSIKISRLVQDFKTTQPPTYWDIYVIFGELTCETHLEYHTYNVELFRQKIFHLVLTPLPFLLSYSFMLLVKFFRLRFIFLQNLSCGFFFCNGCLNKSF